MLTEQFQINLNFWKSFWSTSIYDTTKNYYNEKFITFLKIHQLLWNIKAHHVLESIRNVKARSSTASSGGPDGYTHDNIINPAWTVDNSFKLWESSMLVKWIPSLNLNNFQNFLWDSFRTHKQLDLWSSLIKPVCPG